MDSPSNMTRAEKEQYVIELLKKNKGSRVIAERAHMSFSDIGRIRKKLEKEAELEKRRLEGKGGNNSKSKSKRTQAIKLFSEGKNLTDIVIDLDLPPERVRSILREYLEARNMYDFLQVYDQIRHSGRDTISSFLRLHKIVTDRGMTEQQIIKVLDLANYNQLECLQWKVEFVGNEVNMLEQEKTDCTRHLLFLNNRRDELTEIIDAYESSLKEKREEMAYLNQELMRLDNSVNNKNNKNNESSDTEIFYATGGWQFPETLR